MEEKQKALNKLAFYLKRRNYSKKEIEQKLTSLFVPEVIEWALKEAEKKAWFLSPQEHF